MLPEDSDTSELDIHPAQEVSSGELENWEKVFPIQSSLVETDGVT